MGDKEESKTLIEAEHLICRCCLSSKTLMLNFSDFRDKYIELTGVHVPSSDGLPQWICTECKALLLKSCNFKMKILRVHKVLNDYLSRCAPFPIDGLDPDLLKYATPHLCASETLVFESGKGRNGFQRVLQHEKQIQKSELHAIEVLNDMKLELEKEIDTDVKVESLYESVNDFEDDDLPLLGLKNYKLEFEADSIDNDTVTEPIEPVKKRKKEPKGKKRKKVKKTLDENVELELKKKSSIRKQIELDPEKIRIVTLNPQEQIKQKEEESKAVLNFTYNCKLCFKGFNFEFKLQNHMKKHSPSRGSYQCMICSMYLPTKYSFSVHSLIHTRRYECVKCGRRMIDRASIYNHYRTQHEGILTVIKCDLCGKVSSNEKTHRSHLRNHHSGDRPECDQCGKTFITKDSLTEHMQIHTGVRNYSCPVCSKKCRSRAHVKSHMTIHSDIKDYYCVECDVRFKTAYSLRHHYTRSLKHKDERSFPHGCSSCPRRYETASALEAHVTVQHAGVRPHVCGACGARLASNSSLQKHQKAVHANKRQPPTHVCHTCGKAFRGKSVLTNHMRTHTGEKPFSCDVCQRAFTQRAALRTHNKLVHLKIKRNKGKPDESEEKHLKNEPAPYEWNRTDLYYVPATQFKNIVETINAGL